MSLLIKKLGYVAYCWRCGKKMKRGEEALLTKDWNKGWFAEHWPIKCEEMKHERIQITKDEAGL